ncbi:UNVERIFIED_CONTAM: hypothetical protein Sradi_5094500 [Sesamum radiatum]|uniref:Uncharacterized protein n=1 Tax=Sesamum radiatum TaxID=300843 RepID=A0AAW2M2I6_SESRA
MEASEEHSIMMMLRHLSENLEEFDMKFGRLAVNAQVTGECKLLMIRANPAPLGLQNGD